LTYKTNYVNIFVENKELFNFEISKQSYIPIVFFVRFPRIMVAVIVGGALALCGCTMQSLLKNPIVDSGIIGISSGASLGAVIAISLGFTATNIFAMPLFSGVFALIISAIIYKISTLRGRTDNLLLILSGIIQSKAEEVRAAYENAGFILKQQLTMGEWNTFVMTKVKD